MGFRDVSNEITQVAHAYHYHRPPALVESIRDLLVDILRAVSAFIHQLFQRGGGTSDSKSLSGFLQVAICLAGVLALCAIVYWLIKRAKSWSAAKSATTRGATEVEAILDADNWKRQADKLAAAQQYKPACRAVYLSLLQNMHEHEIADFAPAKTNYEYSYALSKYPGIQMSFKKLAELVETIWFGNRQATQQDYLTALGFLDQLDGEIVEVARVKQAKSPVAE